MTTDPAPSRPDRPESASPASAHPSAPGGESGDARPQRNSPRYIGVAVGAAGAGLVLGGTLLAAYSRFVATTRDLRGGYAVGEDVFGSFDMRIERVADNWAVFALVCGVIVLGVAGALVRRAMSGSPGEGVSAWLIAIVPVVFVLGWYVNDQHMPGVLAKVRFDYPLFERLPTAVAATGLVLVGTVLLPGLIRPARIAAAGRRVVALGAATGLAVSLIVAVVAVRSGDDGRRIDHDIAARTAAPAIPARLGTERYRIPMSGPAAGQAVTDVAAAGTGFVLGDPTGLTAYDGATGAPRWHYHRSGVRDGDRTGVGLVKGSLLAADGGSVVLAQWYNGGVTAFDAVTGELLWTRSEFTDTTGQLLVDSSRFEPPEPTPWRPVRHDGEQPGALAATDNSRVARFDARTGDRMWVADLCTANHSYFAVTTTAVYRIARCGERQATVTALDPATGAVIATRTWELRLNAADLAPNVVQFGDVLVIAFDTAADANAKLIVARPELLPTAIVHAGGIGQILAVDPTGTDMLLAPYTTPYDRDLLEVRRVADGAVRYRLPGIEGRGAGASAPVDVFLTDQVLEANYFEPPSVRFHPELRAWNRTDGAVAETWALADDSRSCHLSGPVVVPGATLVFCASPGGGQLIGFSPH